MQISLLQENVKSSCHGCKVDQGSLKIIEAFLHKNKAKGRKKGQRISNTVSRKKDQRISNTVSQNLSAGINIAKISKSSVPNCQIVFLKYRMVIWHYKNPVRNSNYNILKTLSRDPHSSSLPITNQSESEQYTPLHFYWLSETARPIV